MSVFIVTVGECKALVFESDVMCSFDLKVDHVERLEAMGNMAASLAEKIGQKVQRVSLQVPDEDWDWDEVIADNPDTFKTCDVAEKVTEFGRSLAAVSHEDDVAWADQFDQILYQMDDYLFDLMKMHDLTRKNEEMN